MFFCITVMLYLDYISIIKLKIVYLSYWPHCWDHNSLKSSIKIPNSCSGSIPVSQKSVMLK